ncbi:hypothetical protein COBT_004104 [Conglomerata obtusa]
MTLKNISAKLYESNIIAGPNKCFQIFKDMNYSRKLMKLVPLRRNTDDMKNLRAQFASEIRNIQDNQLIYLDETGLNLHMAPKYGYSRANTKCYKTVQNSKGINVSLLCVIDINIVMAFEIKVGTSK